MATSQLGGDFIIDKNDYLHYAHRSHAPTDRPTVETLLQQLRNLQKHSAGAAPKP